MSIEKMQLVQRDIQVLIQTESMIDNEIYLTDETFDWLAIFQGAKQKINYLTNNCEEELQKYLLFCNDTYDNYLSKIQKIEDVISELSS